MVSTVQDIELSFVPRHRAITMAQHFVVQNLGVHSLTGNECFKDRHRQSTE